MVIFCIYISSFLISNSQFFQVLGWKDMYYLLFSFLFDSFILYYEWNIKIKVYWLKQFFSWSSLDFNAERISLKYFWANYFSGTFATLRNLFPFLLIRCESGGCCLGSKTLICRCCLQSLMVGACSRCFLEYMEIL